MKEALDRSTVGQASGVASHTGCAFCLQIELRSDQVDHSDQILRRTVSTRFSLIIRHGYCLFAVDLDVRIKASQTSHPYASQMKKPLGTYQDPVAFSTLIGKILLLHVCRSVARFRAPLGLRWCCVTLRAGQRQPLFSTTASIFSSTHALSDRHDRDS